ncbi:GNAT family protein [Actinocorallia sp. A-T 12471]|uniref:GNAT family N-acetyltransferase n=1 Tax=Actinocorallia sp. A-T 12471 TaxID=3089813 RepID=UPI0029CFC60B|nr:GNAT family protein [Actinocorallia sp. A-T 12471]MDX6743627.1 GNAT family protein [Actinocorallia sp. A-T 12471]
MYPVAIYGDKVGLREFVEGDVEAVLQVYGDPVVTEHLSFTPRDREQVAKTIATVRAAALQTPRTEYSLAIARSDDGECVGFARLAVDGTHPGQSSAQLGFALRRDAWGQGFGTEAVTHLIDLGFRALGLYRLWGARSPDNTASARLMAKLGMVEEGRIRAHVNIAGTWRDSVVHSLLEPEWAPAS